MLVSTSKEKDQGGDKMYMQRKKPAWMKRDEIIKKYTFGGHQSPNNYLFECDFEDDDEDGEGEVRLWL